MRKKILRAVIYARYSTDMQREESIEGQVKACTELAEKDGVIIVKVYADRAMSGRNDNRPQFQQMLKDAQAGLFDVLYVWKVDRFGRNRYEIILNKQKLKNRKIKIRYAKENIPDTKEGIILESMLEGMAEYYSANLAENVNMGMERNAENCQYNGGNIPFGYKVVNKHFELDEITAPIVKKIFIDYVDGKKATDLARWLEEIGFKNYGRMNILRIIKNKRYTGRYIYTMKDKEICVDGGLPRIISDELFELAQQRKEERKTLPNAGGKFATNSFSGKMICGHCHKSVALTSTKTYDGKGHYHYYRCTNRNCKNKMFVKKQKLDKIIFDFLHTEILTEENIIAISEKAEQMQEQSTDTTTLQSQLKSVEKKIENITNAIENGMFSQSLMDRLNSLENERDEIKVKLVTIPKKKNLTSKEIYDYLSKYINGDFTDEEFQRKLARAFIHNMVITRESLKVSFKINDFIFEKSFVF
jgi:DNA invertase Pin-like site-specific DNA recombinase